MRKVILLFMISIVLGVFSCSKQTIKSTSNGIYSVKSIDNPHPLWVNLDATLTEIKRDGRVSIFLIDRDILL